MSLYLCAMIKPNKDIDDMERENLIEEIQDVLDKLTYSALEIYRLNLDAEPILEASVTLTNLKLMLMENEEGEP